jgi:uncharacterized UPF0160 family protein
MNHQPNSPLKIATHSGPFHADDVFSVAILLEHCLQKGIVPEVIRTRDQALIDAADIAVDVGGAHNPEKMRFDHHQQKESTQASVGMVVEFLTQTEESQKTPEDPLIKTLKALKKVVQDIDLTDLGKGGDKTLSQAIGSFNPTWEEDPTKMDEKFWEAVATTHTTLKKAIEEVRQNPTIRPEVLCAQFSLDLLKNQEVESRYQANALAKEKGQRLFLEACQGAKNGVVSIPTGGLPYQEMFTRAYLESHPKEAQILETIQVIKFPTTNGAFGAVAAPTPDDPFKPKFPFPKEWGGKRGESLATQIAKDTANPQLSLKEGTNPNEYFCHPAGFFIAAGDEAFLDLAIEKSQELTMPKSPNKGEWTEKEIAQALRLCEDIPELENHIFFVNQECGDIENAHHANPTDDQILRYVKKHEFTKQKWFQDLLEKVRNPDKQTETKTPSQLPSRAGRYYSRPLGRLLP